MRLLVEISGNIDDWHRAFAVSPDRPRLPLPYSSAVAFAGCGHEVSAISFSDPSFPSRSKGEFKALYAPDQLRQALSENDLALLWAGSGIKAIMAEARWRMPSNVLLASYVWQFPPGVQRQARLLGWATVFAARRARGLIFMTDEQAGLASERLRARFPIIKFTWGIDSEFYRGRLDVAAFEPGLQQTLRRLLREPFVILAGDQQRRDQDAIRLVEEFGIRLARVPQEAATAAWYRRQIEERKLEDRLFVFEKVDYPLLRFLFQNALAYAGLVDSTWQPAGWTVLCEALASGLPAVVYDGLTTHEMLNLGTTDYLKVVPHQDVSAVAAACAAIREGGEATRAGLADAAREFAATVLDLRQTAPRFVRDAEAVVAPPTALSPIKVMLAHPGTQHSFHLARELDRRGALGSFYTGLAWRPGGRFDRIARLLPERLSRRLRNRRLSLPFDAEVHRRTAIELSALWKLSRGLEEQRIMHRRNELFQKSIPDESLRQADVVVGVDTASWILAERARQLGVPFVLDQTIGHPDAKQAMHDALRRQFPDWDEGFEERRLEVREAEIREQRDAELIVAASSFTRKTLLAAGVPESKVAVIPYGVDCRRFQMGAPKNGRCFRFAFVGTVTARKGIPLLLAAWKKLAPKDAELWLIGPVSKKAMALIAEYDGVVCKGGVPQVEVPGLLQQCDVFVFPSYFEGFGLVVLEAMACGLPVITTEATMGPDLITSGEDGQVIATGDLDQLVEAMRGFLKDRQAARDMGLRARRTAERFSWDEYGNRWMELVRGLVS